MAESRGEHVAGLIAGPIGGTIISRCFFQQAVRYRTFPCLPTLRENFPGLTMGGWVGNVSKGGAAALGIVAGIFVGYVVDAFYPRT
jgi:hypothetical protein